MGEGAGLDGAGDAEVDDPGAVLGQQDVGRLEVAVDHARGVDRTQALRQPCRQGQDRTRRQRPVLVHRVRQRRAFNISRGQPRHRAVNICVDDRSREQSADLARDRDLPPEALPEFGVRGQMSADNLHRDRPAARGTAKEHLPHAARAEAPAQPVRSDQVRISRP